MALIDDAIADLESRNLGEQHDLSEVARKWGVVRSTLTRRWRQQTSSKRDGYSS
jgi:transposase-like protein